jgi:hypothetical protein
MVREQWLNLNGLWQYALTAPLAEKPEHFDGEILVPFPIESQLSGVRQRADGRQLWYQRTVEIPASWRDGRVLLHFGAVDWETRVWVNDIEVGWHQGGYDAFTFDITAALTEAGEQEIVVSVWDPTDAAPQPRGKQVRRPEGIWYTPTTGIWQTVWLEPVSDTAIRSIKMVPNLDDETVEIAIETDGDMVNGSIWFTVLNDAVPIAGVQITEATGNQFTVTVPLNNPALWSPDHPFLHDVQIALYDENRTIIDYASSYFGMRKIALGRDANGHLRLFLNNEPLFHLGLLDQGFWPDGLYTAPTDEALRYDIEVTKQLGFNTIRKHVKIEPARWYYWADKLGVLVWQDMPSGDAYARPGEGEITRSAASAAQFERELERMIDTHFNHPSIVMWVLFNEGWGQYDTARLTAWLKALDPTRLVNSASGWNDLGVGDVLDIHRYPGPAAPTAESERASVLGEFGGLGLPLAGHTWQDTANWGYQQFGDEAALLAGYSDLIQALRGLIETQGLAAAIYTQTTDVEIEVNGMMTYDREIIKMGAEAVFGVNQLVYQPLPRLRPLVATSELEGVSWRYTTEAPPETWADIDYDASEWAEGLGGFGRSTSPVPLVRTTWTERQLWLRHEFELDDTNLSAPYLRVHHIEDAAIYLNGTEIARLPFSTAQYVDIPLANHFRALLRPGRNVLAVQAYRPVHELPPPGPIRQYIDVGLYDVWRAE